MSGGDALGYAGGVVLLAVAWKILVLDIKFKINWNRPPEPPPPPASRERTEK